MGDGEAGADVNSVVSSTCDGPSASCVACSRVVVPSEDEFTASLAGSENRGLFGVDGVARPSHRPDRFEGGVVVGVDVAAAEAGLGRYVRSRTRRARRFVSVVRAATLAVTLRKASGGGVLTFCQRLVFSKNQTTEN